MVDVVTFGEAMIRLAPPNFQRLEQTSSLDVQIGGGELNVAAGVSRLGLKSACPRTRWAGCWRIACVRRAWILRT
jgi:sugar/nucleoside kinase (ribokinase family)